MASTPPMRLIDFGKTNGRVKTPAGSDGRTEQHHAKSVNVNTIMARYHKTGVIDHISKHSPQYGEVSGMAYHQAMNLVATQKTIFEELPSYVKNEFKNDVSEYLDLMATAEGPEKLKELITPALQYNRDGSPNPPERDPEPTPDPIMDPPADPP